MGKSALNIVRFNVMMIHDDVVIYINVEMSDLFENEVPMIMSVIGGMVGAVIDVDVWEVSGYLCVYDCDALFLVTLVTGMD